MSPLPKITEITGHVTDAIDITQVELTLLETLTYGFFAPLGIICMIFIISSWMAILLVAIYDAIENWGCSWLAVSERRPTSKLTNANVYLISDDERATSPLLDVKKWSEDVGEGEDFFSSNGLPNYGTITQMQRHETDDVWESTAASKEMTRKSSSTYQI
ncbi:uncharacterized protein EAE98_009639 [Botrytis deweyae]|uniref:Uncharacterized protein n=1 Tax=Botrytis deweyae TaxID=2478750 RepID=A0ABQ7IBI6_9HELO|nr:uncharacterized protein EAE98_009639 [Botrytis deweyae]KAF7918861.1 hypothetical protein EAE98_009639 [Botrytis deweyae]